MPLRIIRQDITTMQVDAIVNSTNAKMVGYSGVDFAVHKAAGPMLDKACAKLAPLALGSAKITKAYNLDAKYIIHTSGPIWQGGSAGESIILKSCYLESLRLAIKKGCETVAFPLISSGNYGFPKDQVLRFAVQVITEFLFEHELTVYLCVFDRTSYEFSKKLFDEISQAINDEDTEAPIVSYSEADCCFGFSQFEDEEINEEELLESTETRREICGNVPPPPMPRACAAHTGFLKPKRQKKTETLEEYLRTMDKSFAYKLFDLIDARGMTDVECYKKANVDKKTFSKIKCNPQTYKPSKQTAVAFAIALELDMDQTQDLLASAGLTLSRSYTFDKIISFFIQKGVYDIFEINQALFEFDQVLLGC